MPVAAISTIQCRKRFRRSFVEVPLVLALAGNLTYLPQLRAEDSTPSSPRCTDAQWEEEPKAENGHFEAKVSLECKSGASESTRNLSRRLRDALETERTLHSEPSGTATSQLWDVSHTFVQDGDSIRIREEVQLQAKAGSLVYRTRSKEIEGTGLSGYLREIDLQASFSDGAITEGGLRFVLQTRIRIKRPWYAPAFLFYPIAKRKTLTKVHLQALDFATRIAATEGSPLP